MVQELRDELNKSLAPDEQLIADARDVIRNRKQDWAHRNRVNELLGEYETAAQLANGPIPERSAHWREMAYLAAGELRKAIGA